MDTKTANFKLLDFVAVLFVTVVLLSNLLSSAKIIDLGFSIGAIALLFDAGTLVFPISYIFGDILTEVYGYSRARRVIWLGFMAMIIFTVFIWIAGALPADADWQTNTGNTIYDYTGEPGAAYDSFLAERGLPADAGSRAYNAILGGIPSLAVASLIAYLAGSLSNSYVLARMKLMTNGRWLWSRTITSTIVGQGIDTVVFIGIATWLGVFPVDLLLSLIFTNYIFKVGIELILTPVTLPLVKQLKRFEGVDISEVQLSLNPFAFRNQRPSHQ